MTIEIDTGTEELLCSIEDRVATVTLNKPHKKNALGDILTPALREILLVLEADKRVGAVMLTGAGNAFCAGGDVSEMGSSNAPKPKPEDLPTTEEKVSNLIRKQESLTLRLYELSKPTIAALPGAAAGAGLSIALATDLRIASRDAFILTAFVNIGLSGDYGSSWFLNRLIGQSKAKELMFRSERVYAEECERLGLVNRVFDNETFRADAQHYAAEIANGPATALSLMKKNINRGAFQGLRESLAMEAEHLMLANQSPDSTEAVRAFMEKRKPQFHKIAK
ncbi:MAG: enoyl-CoA hydratase [Gammaproteobacteria bacterium]|nr:enoyl-CoA hydratase [Gammaproteobacteria bacterium]